MTILGCNLEGMVHFLQSFSLNTTGIAFMYMYGRSLNFLGGVRPNIFKAAVEVSSLTFYFNGYPNILKKKIDVPYMLMKLNFSVWNQC